MKIYSDKHDSFRICYEIADHVFNKPEKNINKLGLVGIPNMPIAFNNILNPYMVAYSKICISVRRQAGLSKIYNEYE